MSDMRDQIIAKVNQLPAEFHQQVLDFLSMLQTELPKGESGRTLSRFSGSLDSTSAREMIEAIEEGCERVDAGQW